MKIADLIHKLSRFPGEAKVELFGNYIAGNSNVLSITWEDDSSEYADVLILPVEEMVTK